MTGFVLVAPRVAISLLVLLALPLHAQNAPRIAPFDANRDGKLDGEEFVRSELRRFDSADGNRDGRLDRTEARAMMPIGRPGGTVGGRPPPGPPPPKFTSPDLNNDGYIARAEFRDSALRQFRRMDRNRDAVLSATELRPPLR